MVLAHSGRLLHRASSGPRSSPPAPQSKLSTEKSSKSHPLTMATDPPDVQPQAGQTRGMGGPESRYLLDFVKYLCQEPDA